jgi:hypothetical protein
MFPTAVSVWSSKSFGLGDLGSAVEGYWSPRSNYVIDTSLGYDTVTGWADQSGFSRSFTNVVAAQKPKYYATGLNGGPYVEFLAARLSYLELAAPLDHADQFHISAVIKTATDAQFGGNGGSQPGGDNYQLKMNGGGAPATLVEYMNGNGAATSSNLPTHLSSWSAIAWQRTSSTASFYQNGVAAGTGAVQSGTTYRVKQLGIWGGFQFETYDLAALFVGNRILTAAEIASLHSMMRAECGF